MTPAERTAMRETLRAALTRAHLPGATPAHPGVPARPPAVSPDARRERFGRELVALGGQVHEASSRDEVIDLIDGILAALPGEARRAIAWSDAELPVPDLAAGLAARQVVVDHVAPGDLERADRKKALAAATIGITGAAAALAETGSVVVVSGPGRSRLASLLPLVHIALVRRDALTDSLAGLIADQPALVTAGANLVCITGPSRTADIEHTLSRGVHGPRDIHVIFVP